LGVIVSQEAMTAVRAAVDEVKQVITSLSDDEWAMPSGCTGWTVKDLVAHMSSNFKEICEPSPPPPEPIDLPAEQLMEILVEPRKAWSNAEVCAEYLAYCDGAVAGLAALQDEPLASTPVPLADLGTYPMHQYADAFAFDHYCHLRIDLLQPAGPIARTVPAADGAMLRPAIGWMLIGMPQMQPGLERELSAPITLTFTGPAAGSWRIAADGPGGILAITECDSSAADSVATVTTDGHAFVIWGTRREAWRDHCVVTGDEGVAARFLDALNII
jgi:uncharacterized protein (TIGR03083 family)